MLLGVVKCCWVLCVFKYGCVMLGVIVCYSVVVCVVENFFLLCVVKNVVPLRKTFCGFQLCVEWCGVVWCGVVWCGVVWCGVAWCGVVWRGVTWRGVAWCGVAWCGVVWCGVVWCGVVWCGVVWCGVVWCGVVWCGVVWCGVVWRGVVWCGVVWRGEVSTYCFNKILFLYDSFKSTLTFLNQSNQRTSDFSGYQRNSNLQSLI